uniref:Branched-chain amino acid ABC transporter permease n=1 Tax=Geoglobus ahangari TaxID=113653 RepID=A0A7C3YQ42_9EURY
MKRIAEISVILLVALTSYFAGSFYRWLFGIMAIYAIITISWNLMKTIGRLSMGHALLFGLPAYISAMGYQYSVEASIYLFPITIILSGILFFVFSKITGKTAFVFLTFIASIMLWILTPKIVIEKDGILVGGEVGFNFFNVHFHGIFILSVISLIVIYLFTAEITSSRFGYFMKAVGDDETASKAVGINVDRVKLITIMYSSVLAGFAGLLYALDFGHISYEVFSVETSIFPFVASLLSGGNLFLSVLSSFFLVLLKRSLNSVYPGLMDVFYALVLVFSPKIGGFVYVKGKKFIKKL